MLEELKDKKKNGLKVAILALDCSAAFDLVDHRLILHTLGCIGAGARMLAWTKSFLADCKYTVKLGNDYSESWYPKVGVGQGRRLSPTLFNVGCISMSLWGNVRNSVVYADDGCTVICGKNMAELNANLRAACKAKLIGIRWPGSL